MRLSLLGFILVSCTDGSGGGTEIVDAAPLDAPAQGSDGPRGCVNVDAAGDFGIEGLVIGPDGMPLVTSVAAAVTVGSVDSCVTVSCPQVSTQATRILLHDASSTEWTLYVRIPGMPPDFVRVGDAFDLTIDASAGGIPFTTTVDQTNVLSQGGALKLFTALRYDGREPQLGSYGITFGDAGAFCSWSGGVCNYDVHTVRVTKGTESAEATPPQTVSVANLSFTAATFEKLAMFGNGNCDGARSVILWAGFLSP